MMGEEKKLCGKIATHRVNWAGEDSLMCDRHTRGIQNIGNAMGYRPFIQFIPEPDRVGHCVSHISGDEEMPEDSEETSGPVLSERQKAALSGAQLCLTRYKEIGPSGAFGAATIQGTIDRFNHAVKKGWDTRSLEHEMGEFE